MVACVVVSLTASVVCTVVVSFFYLVELPHAANTSAERTVTEPNKILFFIVTLLKYEFIALVYHFLRFFKSLVISLFALIKVSPNH